MKTENEIRKVAEKYIQERIEMILPQGGDGFGPKEVAHNLAQACYFAEYCWMIDLELPKKYHVDTVEKLYEHYLEIHPELLDTADIENIRDYSYYRSKHPAQEIDAVRSARILIKALHDVYGMKEADDVDMLLDVSPLGVEEDKRAAISFTSFKDDGGESWVEELERQAGKAKEIHDRLEAEANEKNRPNMDL